MSKSCPICGELFSDYATWFFCSKCERGMCFAHRDREYNVCAECAKKIREETIRLEAKTDPPLQNKYDLATQNKSPVFFSKGQIVNDEYKVLDTLSITGGEACVYLCEDAALQRNVVLKLYHAGFSPEEDIVKKLIAIKHADIINVLHYGFIGNQLYEVLEYAEGGTLLDRLKEKPFSEEELINCVIPEVLSGLKFIHNNGIVHRDIKPSNIYYRDKEKKDIVIGDFGISFLHESDLSKTKTNVALTLDYAAPELFGWQGVAYIGKEADFYALGVTLIHLYSGIRPFTGMSDLQIFTKHVSEEISMPESLSAKLKALLSGLLTKERNKRWGAFEIECWLKGE